MRYLIILFVLQFCISVAVADHRPDHKDNPVSVSVGANDVVLKVHGVVCSFCGYGLSNGLSQLSYIDRSKYKEGVRIEIENQRVIIAIKPGEEADLAEIYDAIRAGGYEPVDEER